MSTAFLLTAFFGVRAPGAGVIFTLTTGPARKPALPRA